jgi:hypothetical protein
VAGWATSNRTRVFTCDLPAKAAHRLLTPAVQPGRTRRRTTPVGTVLTSTECHSAGSRMVGQYDQSHTENRKVGLTPPLATKTTAQRPCGEITRQGRDRVCLGNARDLAAQASAATMPAAMWAPACYQWPATETVIPE